MYQRCLSILLCGALCVLPGCGGDENPPREILIYPPDGTTSAERTRINIQFNEKLNSSSIDEDTIRLMLDGTEIPGVVVFDEALGDLVSFIPDKRLKLLTTYDAMLEGGIEDRHGNRIGSDMEWSFTVRDGNFRGARFIEDSNDGNAISPQIIFDEDDDGYLIWAQSDGSNFDIIAKKFSVNEDETISNTSNNNDASSPQIAAAAETAIAVWVQSDGTNSRIYANRYSSGDWGTPQIIDGATGAAATPQIAMDDDGNALVVWTESDSVYANRFTSGVGWDTAGAIGAVAGTPGAPRIVIDSGGDGIAIWAEADRIYVNRFDSAITDWTGAGTIDPNTGATSAPHVAVDPDGTNAMAVWSQFDGTDTDILASRYTAGAWSPAEIIDSASLVDDDGDPITLGDALTPQVGMDPAGNAIAVWSQAQGSRSRIFSSRFTPSGGGDWSTAELIENFASPATNFEPQIVVDGAGNAFAVWTADDGDITHIAGNRYRASSFDKGWDNVILLEGDTELNNGDAVGPRLAVSSDYSIIVTWAKAVGDNVADLINVQVNLFD